jgi:hypothetical protein
MRLLFAFVLLSPLALAFAACSGSVLVETGGTGTTGGTGGASGTCPTTPPLSGAACSVPGGETCFYGDTCCPTVYLCGSGAWQELPVECLMPSTCPPAAPADGDPCIVCGQQSPCTWNQCGTGQGLVTAACSQADTWSVNEAPCPPPAACANTTCKPGEVCLQTEGGEGISYGCAPDPCAPAPLSCDCAKVLCGGPPFSCSGAMDGMVTCSCATCP